MAFLLRTHNHRKMARLAVSIAVTFFLFALCHAGIFDASEKDVTGAERVSITTLPKPDAKTPITILLPSEKPESEPATLVELEPEDTESKLPESDARGSDTVSIALRTIDFRPFDRHFPRHPFPLSFRRGHGFRHPFRRHRHHHHDQEHHIVEFKQLGERFPDREVSYGDDMIVSNEVSDSDQVARGVVRQIPAKWAKFGHEESRFNQEDADVEGTEHMKKKWHHRHEEREERMREHHDHDEDHDDDEEHEHKGSLRMWAKIGHEGPRFHHEDADVEGTEHMKRKRHHEDREKREKEHDDDDDDDEEEEHEHKHKGWLRKWARFGHEGPRFHHGYPDEEGREHHEDREEREREHDDDDDEEHEHKHKHKDWLRKWARFGHEGPRFHHGYPDEEGREHHEDREEREREHDDDDDDDDEEHEHKHKHKGWLRKWARFGHEGPRFHHGYAGEEGREHMKKWHHRHAEREHDHDKHGREDDGWMKSVSKFLGQF